MERRWIGLFVILGLSLILLVQPGISAASLSIRDDTGMNVTLDNPPRRIVSLAPNMTEILFSIGAGGQVVGVSDACDYPREVRRLPHVGGVQIETERVLKLRPDLVVANAALQPGVIDQLRRAGLKVIAYSPDRWDRVIATIRRVGEAVGHRHAAEKTIQQMEAKRRQAKAMARGHKRLRVFVEIWNKPLMTAGPGTFVHEMIEMAGGEDIAEGQQRPWTVFPAELVLARNPQVIILTCKNRKEVFSREGWGEVEAVKTGRVYEVDPDIFSRPGPRLGQALKVLCEILSDRKGGSR